LALFPDVGDRGIKRKLDEDEATKEQLILAKLAKQSPSSLSKPSEFDLLSRGVVCCNRPFEFDTIPITLLQEEFGQFMDDCQLTPSAKAQELLRDLTVVACKWHANETFRRSEIQQVFDDKAQLYLSAETISGTEYRTDGTLKGKVMPKAIRECKNESGCALYEAIGYYVQYLKRSLSFRGTRFPCILIVDIGPFIP
jgi:hypothetical protein